MLNILRWDALCENVHGFTGIIAPWLSQLPALVRPLWFAHWPQFSNSKQLKAENSTARYLDNNYCRQHYRKLHCRKVKNTHFDSHSFSLITSFGIIGEQATFRFWGCSKNNNTTSDADLTCSAECSQGWCHWEQTVVAMPTWNDGSLSRERWVFSQFLALHTHTITQFLSIGAHTTKFRKSFLPYCLKYFTAALWFCTVCSCFNVLMFHV